MLSVKNIGSIIKDKKIDYIRLETIEKNVIGQISKILFADSTIIIVNKRMAKAIFMFDFQGNFISKIKKIGKGPSEYLYNGIIFN